MSEYIEKFVCKDCNNIFGKKIGKTEKIINTKGWGCYLLDRKTQSTYHMSCPKCGCDRVKKAS